MPGTFYNRFAGLAAHYKPKLSAMQIPIQIENNGKAVLGVLHLPDQPRKENIILLLNYGLNGDRVDNHRLSILLSTEACKAGMAVLRFDYTGCGISDDVFINTSIASKVLDTIAMIDFIKGCYGEADFQLVLLGYSDGIRVLHKVLESGVSVAAICCWNPIIRSMTNTFRSTDRKLLVEPITRRMVIPLFGMYMGIDYLRDANEDLATDDLLDHPGPKLFVFGTGDRHTLDFQQELKLLHAQRKDFDIREVPDANHLFNRIGWSRAVVTHTLDWIDRQFKNQQL